MPQFKCKILNSGAPTGSDNQERAKVEFDGQQLEVPSLIYFAPGEGIINHFEPTVETGLAHLAGNWLCAAENSIPPGSVPPPVE